MGGHVDAARLLLDKGAAVDRAAKRGTTPLFAACFMGHVDAVRLLLEKGAAVDRAADNGDAAGRCEASATSQSHRAARRVPTISTTTRAAAPRPTAALGRPVLYLPRGVQRPRVDEVQ